MARFRRARERNDRTALKNRSCEQIVRALESNFRLSDYLELRERFPEADSPFWFVMSTDTFNMPSSFDYMFLLKPELDKFGINHAAFRGALDGQSPDMDEFCLGILRAIDHRESINKNRTHAVSSGLAISDAFINFLACLLTELLAYYDLSPFHSFQVLLKTHLKLFDNHYRLAKFEKDRKLLVASLFAENPDISLRTVAKWANLNQGTLSRWMNDEDFTHSIRSLRDSPLKKKTTHVKLEDLGFEID